jgi:hypothetical protein
MYYPREGTYQGNINTVHRPDLAGQPVTKHVKLQVPYGTKNKFLTSRYHSSTGERNESTGSLTHLYR